MGEEKEIKEIDEEIKTVFKVGGSLVFAIPQKYIKAHNIKPGDKVRIFLDDFLHVQPVKKEKIAEKLEKVKEILEEDVS